MPRHPFTPRHSLAARRGVRILAAIALVFTALGPVAGPAAAVGEPTMEARILLGGHARLGSWVAISVHLKNDGPAVSGELRLAGGSQGQTSFGMAVELPTQSDQVHVLYGQPPAFGTSLSVSLVDGDRTIATAKPTFTTHDATQLVVAVVAEHPERIVGNLDLLPNQNQIAPAIVTLSPDDLPERVEAWSAIDRIVWQDVDSERLSTPQRDALRGWIAGGGRLVIAGGTAGPKILSAFPDSLLPYRPVVTTDVPASTLSGILGQIPPGATALPALSGSMIGGRTLVAIGDQVVAAERPYGSGSVALIGFDPTVDWIAKTDTSGSLWRRLLPARTSGGLTFSDDSFLVNAVSQLPTLALPPITGLLALLIAYIVLIGPINYLVLKRLDRREWAWITMPILIVVFAAGAYAYGAVLRGSDVIVNEIAIVRGAPGATEGSAQAYLGVFSPSRSVYQVSVPGGALLSTSITGDMFGGVGTATVLDVLQGDPARVRDLAVGFGSLRTIRAETPVAVPLVEADLHLVDGRLKGTVKNASTQVLQHPAVVLGQTVAVLDDLEPGAEASVDVAVQSGQFTQSLSDKVVGPMFGNEGTMTPDAGPDVCSPLHGRPTDQRPEYGRHQPAVGRWSGPPRLGIERSAPGRDRGSEATASRERPVLPADEAGDQWQDHVPGRHAAVDRRRVRCGRVQPRCRDAQLRPRLGHARLSTGRLRGPDRSLTADHRAQLRRTGPVRLPGAHQTARIDPAGVRAVGDRSVQAC